MQATVAILQGLKQRYQDYHGLIISDDALVAAAQLAGRYITGTFMIRFVHFVGLLL